MERIYLDYAATTPVRPEVAAAMAPYLSHTDGFGNPSSIHSFGQHAKAAIDESRDTLADALGVSPPEIIFTSGGTESDNLAVIGIMTAPGLQRGDHFVTTEIEHEAVLRAAGFLESIGKRVTYLGVDRSGRIDLQELADVVDERTTLVSIMHANNEVGTLQPIDLIARIVHERGALLHTDAVQSFPQLPVVADDLGADAISVSAHKLYGPKGVGALYLKRSVAVQPLIFGGGQERGRRSGTENVAGIVGFAAAVRALMPEREEIAARLSAMRDRFIRDATEAIPGLTINGHWRERLPGNISFSIPGVEGEAMLLNLDLAGIAASSGSACASGSIEPSHVLRAMKLPPDLLRSALRLTLGRDTTQAHLERALAVLAQTTKRLESMTHQNLSAI